MKYPDIPIKDSEFNELQRAMRSAIAKAYGIPLRLLKTRSCTDLKDDKNDT